MSFEYQVAHKIDKLEPSLWNQLSGDQALSSHRWHRFGEAVLKGEKPVYIILSKGGEPVARATFWLKRREPLPIPSNTVRRVMQAVLSRWPLLMCQSAIASASALFLPEPPLRDQALTKITEIALELAHEHKASFVLFPYLEPEASQWTGWPKTFASTQVPNPGTRLLINWPDFQSYLKSLSKSLRKDYRRQHNRAADLGIEVTTHDHVTELDEAITLIRNVERHHNSTPNPWARLALENATMVDTTWLTAKIDDRLVGCGLLSGEGDTRFLALLGLDYEVQYVYFQLFYTAIQCVIEQNVRILRGGGGAYDWKARLGFQQEHNNHLFFVGAGRFFQKLGLWASRSL